MPRSIENIIKQSAFNREVNIHAIYNERAYNDNCQIHSGSFNAWEGMAKLYKIKYENEVMYTMKILSVLHFKRLK